MNGPRPGPVSAAMYRIGGHEYNQHVSPGCKVCHHHLRGRIEYWIALGYGWKDCAANLPADCDITSYNIQNHSKQGHMPLHLATKRALAQQRGGELGIDIDVYGLKIKDSVILLRSVVHQATEEVMAGTMQVTLADAIRAAAALSKIEAEMETPDNLSMEDIGQGMRVFLETAKATMTPSQWQEFSREIAVNEFMRQLMGKEPLEIEASSEEYELDPDSDIDYDEDSIGQIEDEEEDLADVSQ